jgi:endoglucanase
VRRDEWAGGFVRYVTVTNTSTTAVNGWTLAAELAPGQQLTNGWSATWQQDGRNLTARNLDWNARVAPGASIEVGFQGTWTGGDPEPQQWELNGARCTTA